MPHDTAEAPNEVDESVELNTELIDDETNQELPTQFDGPSMTYEQYQAYLARAAQSVEEAANRLGMKRRRGNTEALSEEIPATLTDPKPGRDCADPSPASRWEDLVTPLKADDVKQLQSLALDLRSTPAIRHEIARVQFEIETTLEQIRCSHESKRVYQQSRTHDAQIAKAKIDGVDDEIRRHVDKLCPLLQGRVELQQKLKDLQSLKGTVLKIVEGVA